MVLALPGCLCYLLVLVVPCYLQAQTLQVVLVRLVVLGTLEDQLVLWPLMVLYHRLVLDYPGHQFAQAGLLGLRVLGHPCRPGPPEDQVILLVLPYH